MIFYSADDDDDDGEGKEYDVGEEIGRGPFQ